MTPRPELDPAESQAVAEILSWPDGERDFWGCESFAEWKKLVATANPSRAAAEQQIKAGRGAAALPGFDAARGRKSKKARA